MNNYIELVSPTEAFNRGNLFENYFWPYKYVANVKVNGQRENLMLKIQIFCFAAHELNLYLDLNPSDTGAIGLYNQYTEEANKLKKEYESKYGPIDLDINNEMTWQWIDNPWPWERS